MDISLITRIKYKTGLLWVFFYASLSFFSPVGSFATEEDNILMVINDREITKSEFIRLWKKNSLYAEPLPIEDYLEQYKIFHLKLANARDEGIHLDTAIRNELAGYRRELAVPYLTDPETEEKLAKEAYERLLHNVSASHILVKLTPGYSPDDTLRAWEKAIQIRDRLIEGESFEKVARATSDDPSAKINFGNLGYFTVFQMAYQFENYVYNADKEELSHPVRTQFGYHIIKLNDIRKSRGELKTAHIMIGTDRYTDEEAKDISTRIYNKLISGSDFKELAQEHSTDINTASSGGELPWFGPGRFDPEFENAAFALEKPGDISKPVRTKYGWHIIKLTDQRDIPPFDEIKNKLVNRVRNSGDERSLRIRDALVENLKKEWAFSENPGALEAFFYLTDERIFDGKWNIRDNRFLNQVLFTVKGTRVLQRDFADFISKNSYKRKPWPLDEYIYNLYSEYVKRWLIDHEDKNLETKYPEFRYMMQEYEDGMLLYEITDRKVWSKPFTDSKGLAEFHERNKHNYMWAKRISASIFTTEDKRIARRASRRASRSMPSSNRDDNWIIDRLNRRTEKNIITVREGVFSRGDNHLTDRFKWIECASEVIQDGKKYHVVLIHRVFDPQPKSLEEAGEKVVTDYQEYLEQEWIKDLQEKYNVVINKDVLNKIS